MPKARVVLADCPWAFRDRLPGRGRGAAKHYACLALHEIMRFPLPAIEDDAWLFLWRVHTHQEEARLVMQAWGFEYCSEIVWVKTTQGGRIRIGMGHTIRQSHEVCLVGRRGKPKPRDRGIPSVLVAPRTEHSAKPASMYRLIERFSAGPYCELFARKREKGWASIGDQLELPTPGKAGK